MTVALAYARSNIPSPNRDKDDFYPTPPDATRALLRAETFDGPIWEPAPHNWAELCAQYTQTQMRHKRRWGSVIVTRWTKETGIAPRVYVKPEKPAPKPKKATPFEGRGMPLKSGLTARLRSIWDEAADVLRAERWVVYRCTEKGGADLKGMYWRMGMVILTPDSLLEKAERYGRRAA